MNQQFGLLATPATARRLLLLAQFCKIEISEAIRLLAEQQQVPETLFDPIICPATDDRRLGTQFIIDCDYRCIIVRRFLRAMDATSVLNAARNSSRQVVILTRDRLKWKSVASSLFMLKQVSYVHHAEPLLQDAAKLRDHILIVDINNEATVAGYQMANVLRLYPASLIYIRLDDRSIPVDHGYMVKHCVAWADLLFPQMPPLATSAKPLQESVFHNVLIRSF